MAAGGPLFTITCRGRVIDKYGRDVDCGFMTHQSQIRKVAQRRPNEYHKDSVAEMLTMAKANFMRRKDSNQEKYNFMEGRKNDLSLSIGFHAFLEKFKKGNFYNDANETLRRAKYAYAQLDQRAKQTYRKIYKYGYESGRSEEEGEDRIHYQQNDVHENEKTIVRRLRRTLAFSNYFRLFLSHHPEMTKARALQMAERKFQMLPDTQKYHNYGMNPEVTLSPRSSGDRKSYMDNISKNEISQD